MKSMPAIEMIKQIEDHPNFPQILLAASNEIDELQYILFNAVNSQKYIQKENEKLKDRLERIDNLSEMQRKVQQDYDKIMKIEREVPYYKRVAEKRLQVIKQMRIKYNDREQTMKDEIARAKERYRPKQDLASKLKTYRNLLDEVLEKIEKSK